MDERLQRVKRPQGVVWGAFEQKLFLAELSTRPDNNPAWEEFVSGYLGLPRSLTETVRSVVRERRWAQSSEPWGYVTRRAKQAGKGELRG